MTGWILAVALSSALDASTTCVNFSKGYGERNPLLPANCAGVVGMKVGGVVAYGLGHKHLSKKHPKLDRVLSIVSVAVPSAAVVYNLKLMRRGR